MQPFAPGRLDELVSRQILQFTEPALLLVLAADRANSRTATTDGAWHAFFPGSMQA